MSRLFQCKAFLSSVLLIFCVAAEPARADDFTVDTPITSTFTLGGNDTLTITEDGSITTNTDSEHGVDATGAANTITTNNGSITTNISGASGIFGSDSDNMTVTNNGSVTTSAIGGDAAYGIYIMISDDSKVINNGAVTTLGEASDGISIEDSEGSSIENYGTVVADGLYSYALSSNYSDNSLIMNAGSVVARGQYGIGMTTGDSSGSTIINRGSVTTEGYYVFAVDVWNSTGATVANSGSILTTGEGGFGIINEMSDDTRITSTGTIRTTGIDGYGIYSYDSTGVSVTNSGSIVSERSYAIVLDDGDTVLNLSTTGFIGGGIQFQQTATVNIITARSNSVLWDLSDGSMIGADPASISGNAPWFYNSTTKQFATYDASAFAGSLDILGDMTDLLSSVGRATRAKDGLWMTGFGGAFNHDGDGVVSFDRDIRQYGVALGYSGQMDDGTRWRVMGGYLRSEMDIDAIRSSSFEIDGNNWFVGGNGARDFGALTIDAGFTAGRTNDSSKRFINDNLALTNGLTLGESWAKASYSSRFIAPEIGVSATFGQTEGWSVTPGARVRYASQWVNSFTETGSSANANVDERALGLLVASAEVAVAKSFAHGSAYTRLGYQSRRSTGDSSATVTVINTTNSIGLGDSDSETPYAGIGMDVDLAPGVRLNLAATGFFGDVLTGGQASANFTMAF